MTFNINWDKNGVYVKFRGNVTPQDLIDANNYVISNAKFESIEYQIFDFLHIDEFLITSYDITIIGTMDKGQVDFKEKMKVAILSQDDHVIEITKEYEQLMDGTSWETNIMTNIDDAREWVNA